MEIKPEDLRPLRESTNMMEQLSPHSSTEALWEGKFLEDIPVQELLDKITDLRNMFNLRKFADTLDPTPNMKVKSALALAGGIGTELFMIKPERAVLVEMNQKLIDKAILFAQDQKFSLETLFYNITKLPLPFKDKEFDLVIINSAIEHIPNIYDLVDEMKRIGHNFFIGAIPIGDPPRDHLHVWKWKDRNDVKEFVTRINGLMLGSYWAHYDVLWRESYGT